LKIDDPHYRFASPLVWCAHCKVDRIGRVAGCPDQQVRLWCRTCNGVLSGLPMTHEALMTRVDVVERLVRIADTARRPLTADEAFRIASFGAGT
jgi:hypothetical protein